ncbi:MAG: phosphopantetheine-binding protein, partial [Balneolaceae bacterium]
MDRFPLTPNGKLDRKTLPDPEFDRGDDYVPPSTRTEEVLVEIWSQVLGVESTTIGVNDNFFDLGGNSLSSITLRNKIAYELGIRIPLKMIFEMHTVKYIGAVVDTLIADKKDVESGQDFIF